MHCIRNFQNHVFQLKILYILLRNSLQSQRGSQDVPRHCAGGIAVALVVDRGNRYAQEATLTAAEPLFTGPNAFQFLPFSKRGSLETVTLVGNLCTAADVIAEDICMPRLECGDNVVITNAGAYAAALSPMQFSAQEKPVEVFLTQAGDILDS